MNYLVFIAAAVLDTGLILFLGISLLLKRRYQKQEERLYGKRPQVEDKGLWAWITPAGETIESWIRKLDRKNGGSGDEVRRLLRDLSGKELGEQQYLRYRAKRWGSTLLSLVLVLSLFLTVHGLAERKDRTLSPVIERPEYGEGDETARIKMVFPGDESSVKEFSLKIPEKAISEEMAQLVLDKTVQQLQKAYDGKVITGSVVFPSTMTVEGGNVAVTYRSLEPKLLRSSGTLLAMPSEERQAARVQITCTIGGYKEEAMVTLQIASEKEVDDVLESDLLIEEIQKGQFTTDTEILLPVTTEDGSEILYQTAGEENSFLWVVLMVLVPSLVIAKQDSDYKELSAKRMAQIKSTYPEFIGELVILMGAGLSLSSAWQRLGRDYRHKKETEGEAGNSMLMEEVSRTGLEMEEGISIRDALDRFADRIPVTEVRRFVSLLTQNLRRGDAYVLTRLKELADDAWETRKKQAREKSEEVDTKLMLPLMMLLVVILIMVLSPALISMKF